MDLKPIKLEKVGPNEWINRENLEWDHPDRIGYFKDLGCLYTGEVIEMDIPKSKTIELPNNIPTW